MKRKRVYFIIVLGILLSFFSNSILVDGVESGYQKIELRMKELSWSLDNDESYPNRSIFKIITNVSINNPNDYPVGYTFSTPRGPLIPTAANISLDEELQESFHCTWISFVQELWYEEIAQGYSTRASISYIHIHEVGLTALPDGEYLFWNYIFGQNKTEYINNHALLTIKNGYAMLQEIPIPPTITSPISRFFVVFSVVVVSILIGYIRKIK